MKAGVLLDDLCRPEDAPPALFAAPSPRSDALMAAMDRVNAKHGRSTLFPTAAGIERGWKLRTAHHSPRYTTRPEELRAAACAGVGRHVLKTVAGALAREGVERLLDWTRSGD